MDVLRLSPGLADGEGLSTDPDARRLLSAVQQRGVPASEWIAKETPDTVYFACPQEAQELLDEVLKSLEELGQFESGFLAKRSEYLFSLAERSPAPGAGADGRFEEP